MAVDELNLWIQTAVAVAAVAAAIIALVVSAKDRQNAREIAAEDRRAALEHARLMFDLDVLTRLSRNLERGGHDDKSVSRDMGAEAAALINAIGPDRLPVTWSDRRKASLDDVREWLADEDKFPAWKRDGHEVLLELRRVADRIDELIKRE
ncbi:hypothetical protein KZX45_05755 [Georgenia sp. EYE_87]|uniref:hypothetical protein n=1 Tax=Georgenia sp. EYE_87 TaxID=2853448 RepID=UPI002003240D|nr:hypothetical protein [Georgenia sp. EYE_87]MCK6210046.1 hypothetical protein [Georgenia sp. EYE_87]